MEKPDVEFGELPPNGRDRHPHLEIAQALRAAPGKWAKIAVGNTQTAAHIRGGRIKAYLPKGSFESAARNISGGTCDIWARFVGENGEHA